MNNIQIKSIELLFDSIAALAAHLTPITLPGRCLYVFLFLSSIVIYNYYASVLISSLLSGPTEAVITDVWKLAKSDLIFRTEDVPYLRTYFKVPLSFLIRNAYKDRTDHNTTFDRDRH